MTREQENFVSRRAVLPMAATALASAAVIPTVAAQSSSEIARLIEAHRVTMAAFGKACTQEDTTPKEAPEYPAAKRAWQAANEADETAFVAVCACVCRSAADGHMKPNISRKCSTLWADVSSASMWMRFCNQSREARPMSDTSRRSLLAGLSVAPIALAPAVAAVPFAGSPELHSLWNKRRALRPVLLENAAQCAAATAALPWWAKPGPSRLYSDGTMSGEVSNWPAIRDMKLPTMPGAFRNLRPSQNDLRKDYEDLIAFHGNSPARRGSYRAALQRFEARKREQRAEEAKAGLTALEKQRDELFDDLFAISKAIEALPDRTPDAVAASLLIEFNLEAHTHDKTGCNIQGIAGALRIMLPCLTGNIAADAADLLDNPDSLVADRMAWIS